MRHVALAAVLALGLLAAPVAGGFRPAAAQDRKKDKDEDKKREEQRKKERERRERTLRAIGGEFGSKDVDSLVNRIKPDGKVSLKLGGNDGDSSVAQARAILTDYFAKFQTISVEFTKADDTVGSFTMRLRKRGEDQEKSRKLTVQIEGRDGSYTLVSITVEA